MRMMMMMGIFWLIVFSLINVEVCKSDTIAPYGSTSEINATIISSTTSVIPTIIRRLSFTVTGNSTNARVRDTKLMSVLAARRHALTRNRDRGYSAIAKQNTSANIMLLSANNSNRQFSMTDSIINLRSQCEQNCTSNFTIRATAGCMRKCALQYKIGLSNNNIDNRTSDYSVSISSRNRLNTIIANVATLDELLDTEESQTNGLYYDNNFKTKYELNNSSTAKDQNNNSIILRNNNYKHNTIENEVRHSSTEKMYLKLLRGTIEARHKKIEPTRTVGGYRNRKISLSTTGVEPTITTTASMEVVTLELTTETPRSQSNFSQKLLSVRKLNDSTNFLTPVSSSSVLSTMPVYKNNGDHGELEIVANPLSNFERNKFRRFIPHNRNVFTLNRKYSGTIPKAVLDILNNNVSVDSSTSIPNRKVFLESDLKFVNKSSMHIDSTTSEIPRPITTISRMKKFSILEQNLYNNQSELSYPIESLQPNNSDVSNLTKQYVVASSGSLMESFIEKSSIEVTERNVANETYTIPHKNTKTQSIKHKLFGATVGIDENTSESMIKIKNEISLLSAPLSNDFALTITPDQLISPKINYTTHHPDEIPNLILFLPPKDLKQESQTDSFANSSSSYPGTSISITKTTSSIRYTIDLEYNSTTQATTPVQTSHFNDAIDLKKTSITTQEPMHINFKQTVPNSTDLKSTIFQNVSSAKPILPDLTIIIKPSSKQSTEQPFIIGDEVLQTQNNDVTIEMHRMNMATYVLGGLGTMPIIVIALYLIRLLIFRKHSKSDEGQERYKSDNEKPISPVVRLVHDSGHQSLNYDVESIMTEQTFNRNQLKFKNLLGEGNFGQVWKAEADDLAGHIGTTRIVAVKTERCPSTYYGGLREEAKIMKKLGSHTNVVTLLGACTEKEPHLLIMEFAMRGKLLSLLRTAKSASVGSSTLTLEDSNITPLSPRRLAGFALDIARGMEYIAEKRIVHRDLAARNVLLDHNSVCKICDFGMSVDLDNINQTQKTIDGKCDLFKNHLITSDAARLKFDLNNRTLGLDQKNENNCRRPALPIRWMAPEALQYHIFSTETDVWAFGIVLWEIATMGCTPYPTLSGREVVRNVPNGARPEIPIDCRPELYDLIIRSWCKDPRHRPTFTEARIALAQCLSQWEIEDNSSDYLDVSGFSEDLEHGVVYFNRRISEFECEI